MKQLAYIFGISLMVLVGVAGGCGWSGWSVVQDLVHNRFVESSFTSHLFGWCTNGLPFVGELSRILDNRKYLVLLQNNMELRPSGGFLGSYAVASLVPTGLESIRIQDVYVPDGQLVGHVDPPRPIQQAFGQGWWKLRDSNWDPDFKVAAEQVAWFFDQGGEAADGLIAVNLSLIHPLLEILGPIKTTDYPETITAANFYELAQRYAEENFFPGSTQKRDFLGAVGKGVVRQILSADPVAKIKIAKLVWQQLKQGQIALWFKDESLQRIAEIRNWAGELGKPTGNYLYIVETNLGANKANCCVTKKVVHKLTPTPDGDINAVTIEWTNSSPYANPVKPIFWGGNYIDYVRVVVPAVASVQAVQVGDERLQLASEFVWQVGLQSSIYTIEDRENFKVVGFWAVVPAGQSTKAKLNYRLPGAATITVKRQPGTDGFDYRLIVAGREIANTKIAADANIGPWTK